MATGLAVAGSAVAFATYGGCWNAHEHGAAAGDEGGPAHAGARHSGEEGRDPPPEGWRRLGGLPEQCNVLIAEDPGSYERFHWRPCFDKRPGCRELAVDWGDWREYGVFELPVYGASGPKRRVFGFRRDLGDQRSERIYIDGEGRPIAVVRYTPSPSEGCLVAAHATTDRELTIGFLTEKLSDDEAFRFYRAPFAGLADAEGISTDRGALVTQRTDMSSELFAVEHGPGRIGVMGAVEGRMPVYSPLERNAMQPCVVDDEVFYRADSYDNSRVEVIRSDGRQEPYLDSDEHDVSQLDSDGEHAIWMRLYEKTDSYRWERIEVWGSPFASEPDELEPRFLLEIEGGVLPVVSTRVGGGWASVSLRNSSLALIRMRDDRIWRVEPPDDHIFGWRPWYIDEEELGILVQDEHAVRRRTFFRIQLDAVVAGAGEPYR